MFQKSYVFKVKDLKSYVIVVQIINQNTENFL